MFAVRVCLCDFKDSYEKGMLYYNQTIPTDPSPSIGF